MTARERYDYVVVGAGSAGCVVAARLAERSSRRVLLLEAGPRDRSPWIHVPIGFFRSVADPRLNWRFEAEFGAGAPERRVPWPRGRVLGGSSSINGLVYIRGQRDDYDAWAASGARGWSWRDVAPYFERLESERIGVDVPRYTHVLCDAFVEAGVRRGLARTMDFNGDAQGGVGYYRLNTREGRRSSAARAYLHPARRLGNLTVRTGALVERLEIANAAANGVWYRSGGERCLATATSEVVLCAGAIGSPQILQLSGIGPAQALEAAGVAVHRDVPAVGANLQDHFAARIVARVRGAATLNELSRSVFGRLRMGVEYLTFRRGPLTLGAAMAGAFLAVDDASGRPDVQLLFGPLSTDNPALGLHSFPGLTLTVCALRPRSAGSVTIRSADPAVHPRIVANYLAHDYDRRVLVAGLRFARELLRTQPLAPYVEREHLPGAECEGEDALLAFAHARGGSIYHPVGTCRLGADDDAVVDPELRVRGIAGLRVADASVMPTIPSGNTNAACLMIGERAADLLTGT